MPTAHLTASALGLVPPCGSPSEVLARYALGNTMLPAQPAVLSCPDPSVHSPGARAGQTAHPQEAR